jgi:hypothetical protein
VRHAPIHFVPQGLPSEQVHNIHQARFANTPLGEPVTPPKTAAYKRLYNGQRVG